MKNTSIVNFPMLHNNNFLATVVLLLFFQVIRPLPLSSQYLHVPGLVFDLKHSQNHHQNPNHRYAYNLGGDSGAPAGHGFYWFQLADDTSSDFDYSALPAGFVFGLRHFPNQAHLAKWAHLKVKGRNVITDRPPIGFRRYRGGDLGGGIAASLIWYETVTVGRIDWNLVDQLPKYTVLGLKHNVNQPDKQFYWNGIKYDPADPNIVPPPGFRRVVGGDRGAKSGQGYFWYEKISGPLVRLERW